LTRGILLADRAPGYLVRLAENRSRTALTSGGLEPVADTGSGSNSVFTGALLQELRANEGLLEANELFMNLRRRVALNSHQTPQYAPIVHAGHEDGEFLFVARSRTTLDRPGLTSQSDITDSKFDLDRVPIHAPTPQMEELLRTRLSPVFGYAMPLRPVLEDDAPREQP
jgi:hypothetical protein